MTTVEALSATVFFRRAIAAHERGDADVPTADFTSCPTDA